MSDLNERIREVRKSFNLSQKDFATELGISQRAVSWGEQSGNNVPDSTIKSISRAFSVSESWLRTGEGEMYDPSSDFDLTAYAKERGATELELEIVKAYFDLPEGLRHQVLDHFRARLSGSDVESSPPDRLAQAEAEYEKTLHSRRSMASSASSTTTAATESAEKDA